MESMADTAQQVKEKLTIVEVVTPYVKLTKAGRYYKGLTPFGKEKTPSFFVNPERGTYYCFSTSQGGDHFTFIEKMEGVDFKGALKILAEKAGVPLEYHRGGKQEHEKFERLRGAVAEAERFYADLLTESSVAYAYATLRGLTKDTIRNWGLGAAPDDWRKLLEHLTGKGYSTKELAEAGLVKEADEKRGTFYDRFRNRLVFPIRDMAGRTVAFTGRALSPDDQAKYLNSPETVLYKKSEILFGMDRAKDTIRTRGFAILVEGQFDLVLLHQAGFTNTVALSGTALSERHLALVKRYADNLMLCLDADRAGLASSARSAELALSSGMRVKAVRMPEGKDPADIVSSGKDGAQQIARLLKESQSIVEFFLAVLSADISDDLALLREVERTVLPFVVATESPLERERLVSIVARALSTTPEAVRESLTRVTKAHTQSGSETRKSTEVRPSTPLSSVKIRRDFIIAVIVVYPDTALAERLTAEYTRIIGAPPPDGGVDERLLFEAGLAFGETPSADAADELLQRFEFSIVSEALKQATIELRRAEVAGGKEAIEAAARACQELATKKASLA